MNRRTQGHFGSILPGDPLASVSDVFREAGQTHLTMMIQECASRRQEVSLSHPGWA